MKSKLKSIILLGSILLLMLIFCGCSLYYPKSFWEESKIKVDLEGKNFKVRKLGAQGNAVSTYLFGFPMGKSIIGIPLTPQDIQAQAMRNLHMNWDGKGSCFFHNINVEWTNYGVPFILVFHQYTITADIYEFDREYVDYPIRRIEEK